MFCIRRCDSPRLQKAGAANASNSQGTPVVGVVDPACSVPRESHLLVPKFGYPLLIVCIVQKTSKSFANIMHCTEGLDTCV